MNSQAVTSQVKVQSGSGTPTGVNLCILLPRLAILQLFLPPLPDPGDPGFRINSRSRPGRERGASLALRLRSVVLGQGSSRQQAPCWSPNLARSQADSRAGGVGGHCIRTPRRKSDETHRGGESSDPGVTCGRPHRAPGDTRHRRYSLGH